MQLILNILPLLQLPPIFRQAAVLQDSQFAITSDGLLYSDQFIHSHVQIKSVLLDLRSSTTITFAIVVDNKAIVNNKHNSRLYFILNTLSWIEEVVWKVEYSESENNHCFLLSGWFFNVWECEQKVILKHVDRVMLCSLLSLSGHRLFISYSFSKSWKKRYILICVEMNNMIHRSREGFIRRRSDSRESYIERWFPASGEERRYGPETYVTGIAKNGMNTPSHTYYVSLSFSFFSSEYLEQPWTFDSTREAITREQLWICVVFSTSARKNEYSLEVVDTISEQLPKNERNMLLEENVANETALSIKRFFFVHLGVKSSVIGRSEEVTTDQLHAFLRKIRLNLVTLNIRRKHAIDGNNIMKRKTASTVRIPSMIMCLIALSCMIERRFHTSLRFSQIGKMLPNITTVTTQWLVRNRRSKGRQIDVLVDVAACSGVHIWSVIGSFLRLGWTDNHPLCLWRRGGPYRLTKKKTKSSRRLRAISLFLSLFERLAPTRLLGPHALFSCGICVKN